MAKYKNLKFEVAASGIATITINRPDKLNALNIETMAEIRTAIEAVADDEIIKAAIFTGEGPKAFVAGADISEISGLTEVNARKFSEQGQATFAMIEGCSKPVIAAIDGFALGGGAELAMACHIRVATKISKFGQPEVKLGLIPGYGATQRLTQLVGKAKALELMLTADTINADEAFLLGLVNHVVDTREDLFIKAEGILNKILAMAPIAVSHIINCVNAVETDDNGYQTEANSFANCCGTKDFEEGTHAFLEKRKAIFKGN